MGKAGAVARGLCPRQNFTFLSKVFRNYPSAGRERMTGFEAVNMSRKSRLCTRIPPPGHPRTLLPKAAVSRKLLF
jgi:hypothetical protein